MARSSVHRFVSLLVALAVGAGLYRVVDDPGLAAAAGITWGIGFLVVFRVARRYPSRATGTAWADKRWTALGSGLVALAALVGVSPTLPVSADLRFGLGVLVLGAGLVGYATATAAELERQSA